MGRHDPADLEAAVDAADPALAAQMRAASAEALALRARGIDHAASTWPGQFSELRSDRTASDQLYGHFLRVMVGLANGTVPHCPHIRLGAPRPAIMVVFAPSIDCHSCFPLRPRPRLDEREEHTCDLCRSYRPHQTIHHVMPQCGPFMLVAGMCDTCRDRLAAGQ